MDNPNINKSLAPVAKLELTQDWDKVFPLSDKVDHKKVTYVNKYGITLAADMYIPKSGKAPFPALAVSGPFGAVKEQSSGLYAQQMAERGFLTIAFDPSFTGESGGMPRRMASPDINTEDFLASVDFLSVQDNVNPEQIGIIGICGFGGMAISAAAEDPRIKVTIASTMYDMSRQLSNGYFDSEDNPDARYKKLQEMAKQRTEDYKNGFYERAGGVPDNVPSDAPQFLKNYFDYYKTPRGFHPRSGNSTDGWTVIMPEAFINFPLLYRAGDIRNAVMLVHGDKAHSFYFSEDTFKKLVGENKEFLIIKGANHTDLYDNVNIIPFDQIEVFIRKHLSLGD